MLGQQLPFDLSQPAGQVLAIVFFLIPGLNVTWVTDRLAGRSPLSPTERLLRAMTWSVVIYAGASPWLVRVAHCLEDHRLWVWELVLAGAALVLAVPVALGLLLAWLRRAGWTKTLMSRLTRLDPAPSAWDFAFRDGGPYFVRLEFRNGERVGGVFAAGSFASAYPGPQDLFLEAVWLLDEEGTFVEPIPGSRGLVIARSELRAIELVAPQEGESRYGEGDKG